jgi:hypothetical protein
MLLLHATFYKAGTLLKWKFNVVLLSAYY